VTETETSDLNARLDHQDTLRQNNPNNQTSLEGKMVAFPCSSKGQSENIMVLIDREKGLVFSAFDQNDDGSQRIVGKLKSGEDDEKIQFDPLFLATKIKGVENSFPYPTDTDDHCESPANAYEDIIPLLERIAEIKGVSKEKLVLYDPYYCNGSVIDNLTTLGFPNVYNKKRRLLSEMGIKHTPSTRCIYNQSAI